MKASRLLRGLLLWGDRPGVVNLAATAATVGMLVWSRFALLASGPWEWDETLFARGIYAFSLAAHFPHPPGFPGWLAIGHLLLPLAGTPLAALQWATAAASVLAVWPLAALGRRVAPPAVATAAAVLVLLAPGPWLHAVRGFSSTAAAVLALAAAVVAVRGLERWRATAFTLLVTGAFLIRPILLPPLGVLWLAGAVGVRPRRRLLPGLALAAAAVLGATWAMAAAEGGWGAMAAAFAAHAGRHFSRLVNNPGGVAHLGLVKGLGGAAPAAAVAVLALLGLEVWRRRAGGRQALAWALVLAVAVLQLLFLQNRTYSRYAVPVQLALAPLAAGAAAAVAPPAVAVAGLGGLALVLAGGAYPLVVEQHASQLPGWWAVDTAERIAAVHGTAVVVEPELYPFASYCWYLAGRGRWPDTPKLVLSPWAPEPWAGVDRPYLVATDHPDRYLAPLAGRSLTDRWVSDAMRPLTQDRFLEAEVLANPPLPVGRWWPVERTPAGEPFMWASAGASLDLPPLPPGSGLEVELEPAPGPAPLVVLVNGRPAVTLPGSAGQRYQWLSPDLFHGATGNRLTLERAAVYRPSGRDGRPLAVRVFGVRVLGPAVPWAGALGTPAERARLRAVLDGAWEAERFAGLGEGVWLRPEATLALPAGEGTLHLCVAAPRPRSPRLEVWVGERLAAGPLAVGSGVTRVNVLLGPGEGVGGRVQLRLVSDVFVPAAAGLGSDRRELGVVLLGASFDPPRRVRAGWAW